MSATGIEARAAPAAAGSEAGHNLRGFIFVAAFLLVWVSTGPFKGSYEVPNEDTANVVNQLSFSLIAVLGIVSAALSGGRAAQAYLRPSWILLITWMTIGVIQSANPDVSMRAFRFTLVVLVIAGSIMLLPQGRRHFASLIGTASLIVVLICYAGLVIYPDIAVHSAGDALEPEHAGAWRGLFDHKNIAGAMMVVFVLIGIFVMTTSPRLGWALAGLATVFLFFTGSKTSMGLGPFVVLVGLACARIRSLWLRALLALGPLALLLTATIGSVLFKPIDTALQALSPGQTFTGRTEIWKFALDRLWNRPILGYGFEGFWRSDYVMFADIGEGETGIAQGMVHGHSGYVDLAIGLGIPGMMLALIVLILLPLRDHHRVLPKPENKALAELFFRIWLFCVYSACLESFFFRRADPVWFALLVSVIGLRLTSKYRVTA
ncbi:O-antigen ligase [Bosea sp. BE125]|uniref:O-antigen ligase family protein n=1 Tax=Bosea sp. BE125 TaxID=2817909 RepID=UPI0028564551|nr:O-antigen ligase [Bosea sp. BE125]MDR6872416.1 O-antigen ligase [Bosea sp. BE125]